PETWPPRASWRAACSRRTHRCRPIARCSTGRVPPARRRSPSSVTTTRSANSCCGSPRRARPTSTQRHFRSVSTIPGSTNVFVRWCASVPRSAGGCRGQADRVERRPLMDLRDGPEEAAFRATLRTWLEANVPSGLRGFRGWSGPALELGRDWSKRLAQAGYAGLTWPKEYGGAGQPWRYQAVYLEELARAEAPQHLGVIGLGMAGPTIIAHGRPDQKTRYLAKILSAEDIWCQGFSEPGSGSDLASVRTRVELIGDRFVVNGPE